MADRETLLEILNKPIFPHEMVDPLEAVTDYLLDNDVVPVVRCKNCRKRIYDEWERLYWCAECQWKCNNGEWHCAGGERKDNDKKDLSVSE